MGLPYIDEKRVGIWGWVSLRVLSFMRSTLIPSACAVVRRVPHKQGHRDELVCLHARHGRRSSHGLALLRHDLCVQA